MSARTHCELLCLPANQPTTLQAQTRSSIIALRLHSPMRTARGTDQGALTPHPSLIVEHPAQLQTLRHARAPSHVHIIGPLPSAVDHKMSGTMICSGWPKSPFTLTDHHHHVEAKRARSQYLQSRKRRRAAKITPGGK